MAPRWGEITAGEIVSPIQGEIVSGDPKSLLTGLCTDSREIRPCQLFWAIKGENYDGHDFAKQALERGASGILIRRAYPPELPPGSDSVVIVVQDTLRALGDLAMWWRHQHVVSVAAITGSAGKTTTKEMAASILGLGTRTLRNEGNFNNLVGLPLTLLKLEESHRRAVLEMGMNRPGEIARLTEVADPDVGLITNVGRAHLEGVGDIEGVAKAKAELLENMSAHGQMVLNGDDDLLMRVAAPFRKRVITFGLGPLNDVRAEKIRNLGRSGIRFELRYNGHSTAIRLRVPGIQNVLNSLAASAIAFCLKETLENIAKGLNRFVGMKGRFKLVPLPGGATLVDDTYNANPSSLKVAIESLKELAVDGGRVIIGLGEMLELGNETAHAHVEAGCMVAQLGACCFVALGEHAGEMVKGAVSRGFPPEKTLVARGHREMVEKIIDVMRNGDLILLKGSRGMRLEKVAEALVGNKTEEV